MDPSLAVVKATDLAGVVGQYTKVRIVAGGLLAAGLLQPGALVAPGSAVVAVTIPAGELPAGLHERSQVADRHSCDRRRRRGATRSRSCRGAPRCAGFRHRPTVRLIRGLSARRRRGCGPEHRVRVVLLRPWCRPVRNLTVSLVAWSATVAPLPHSGWQRRGRPATHASWPSSIRPGAVWPRGSTCRGRQVSRRRPRRRRQARGRLRAPVDDARAPSGVEVLVAPTRAVEAAAVVHAAASSVLPVLAAIDQPVVLADGGRLRGGLSNLVTQSNVVVVAHRQHSGSAAAAALGIERVADLTSHLACVRSPRSLH